MQLAVPMTLPLLVPPLLPQAGAETKTKANRDQTTNTATQADKHAQAQHATSCAVNVIGFAYIPKRKERKSATAHNRHQNLESRSHG